jgi:hypothetical protein
MSNMSHDEHERAIFEQAFQPPGDQATEARDHPEPRSAEWLAYARAELDRLALDALDEADGWPLAPPPVARPSGRRRPV